MNGGGKKGKKMKISIRRRFITIMQTAGGREMHPRQKASLPGRCTAFLEKSPGLAEERVEERLAFPLQCVLPLEAA